MKTPLKITAWIVGCLIALLLVLFGVLGYRAFDDSQKSARLSCFMHVEDSLSGLLRNKRDEYEIKPRGEWQILSDEASAALIKEVVDKNSDCGNRDNPFPESRVV